MAKTIVIVESPSTAKTIAKYLGSSYNAVVIDTPNYKANEVPDTYVLYTVTMYPDYSYSRQCVTRIDIKDAKISVYGLTMDSSAGEWDSLLKSMGYEISIIETEGQPPLHVAKTKGFAFSYGRDGISITAEVSNKYNIVKLSFTLGASTKYPKNGIKANPNAKIITIIMLYIFLYNLTYKFILL